MPDKRVNVRRTDGTVYSTTAERAEKLKIFGYEIETPEEQEGRLVEKFNKENRTTAGQKVATAAEGFASGLTLGGSDLIFDSDAARERAQYNPGVRIGSEIVGALAPAFLTGGATAEASVAKTAVTVGSALEAANEVRGAARAASFLREGGILGATPAGLVTRGGRAIESAVGGTKGAIAAGAFEGAVGGAGATITNAKLTGDPVTAESLIANVGIGTVLGGGLGGIGKKLEGVTPYIAEEVPALGRAERTAGDDALEQFYGSLPKEKKAASNTPSVREQTDIAPDDKVSNYVQREVTEKPFSKTDFIVDDAHYGEIHGNVMESVKAVDDVAKEADTVLDRALTDLKQFESQVDNLGGAVDTIKRNATKGQALANKEYELDFAAAQRQARADYVAAKDKWNAVKRINDDKYKELMKEWKADPKNVPHPTPPPVNKFPTMKSDSEIRAEFGSRFNTENLEEKFSPLGQAYKDLKAALRTADPKEAAEKLAAYQKLVKETIGEGAGLPGVSGDIEQLRRSVAAAEQAVKLKQAGNALRNFPATLTSFRKMTPARLEKMIAALDTVAGRAEFVGIKASLDEALNRIGMKVEGSVGNKARALWQSDKQIGKLVTTKGVEEVAKTKFKLPSMGDDTPIEPLRFDDLTDVDGLPTKHDNITPAHPIDPIEQYLNPQAVPGVNPDLASATFEPTKMPEFVSDPPVADVRRDTRWRKLSGDGFWNKAINSMGARWGSKAARKLGLGVGGAALGYELGGSATDSLMGGAFAASMVSGRTGTVGRLRSMASRTAPKIGKAITAMRARVGSIAMRIDGTLDDSDKKPSDKLKDRINEVNTVAPNFKAKVFEVISPIMEQEPEFAKALYNSFNTAFQALQSFLPRDPGRSFSRAKSLWQPTPVEVRQAEKVLGIFHHPLEALESLVDSGRPDTFSVKVMKEMWPGLYEQFKVEMLLNLAQEGVLSNMKYDQQAHISALTGIPLHSSFTPRSIAAAQKLFQVEGNAERQSKLAPSGSNGGGRPTKSEPPTAGQSLLNQ